MTAEVRINGYKKNRQRRVRTLKVLALFVLLAFAILGIGVYTYITREATLTISVVQEEILKGETVPAFSVEVSIEGSEKAFVDKEREYTAQEFAEDIKALKGFTIECAADGQSEGEFPIRLVMDEELKKMVANGYIGKVRILLKDGILRVKNPIGEWEGNKFRRYDGTYVANEFILSESDMFYFDEDGNKVTGWETINDAKFYFDQDGVLQKEMWKKTQKGTYYLSSYGAALTGWQEIDGATYYFNQDGKMQTGMIYLGIAMCKFDTDGRLISKEVTSIDPNKPMVALTFDDGPGKRTAELLDVLEEYSAHATFFVLGTNVERYPDEIKKMQEIGCEVGNHSYDHEDLSKLKKAGVKNQINTTNEIIREITGYGVPLVRPPYGAISEVMKKQLEQPMILWNIDTLDWKTRNAKKTIKAVMKDVKDGDIILMHDIHSETVDAAIKLIPKLQEEGYQLVTVSEMAAAKGIQLEAGEKYTDF